MTERVSAAGRRCQCTMPATGDMRFVFQQYSDPAADCAYIALLPMYAVCYWQIVPPARNAPFCLPCKWKRIRLSVETFPLARGNVSGCFSACRPSLPFPLCQHPAYFTRGVLWCGLPYFAKNCRHVAIARTKTPSRQTLGRFLRVVLGAPY